MEAQHLNKQEFLAKVVNYEKNPGKWVFEGDKPAVVEFFATWCPHCQKMSPIVNELAEEFKGKVDIYKVDIDKENEVASVFGVEGIPTFVFIPKNGEPSKASGEMEKDQLKKIIEGLK